MKVSFKKLSPNAITPSYAKQGDAGLDISAITYTINKEHSFIEYHTGLAFEIPKGHVGLLFPRSSVCPDISNFKLPVPDSEKNYGYAFQWFAFALTLLIIFLRLGITKNDKPTK